MALNSEVWQGHYGEALVRGLACAAGLTTSKKDIDVDGVDLQIGFPGRLNSLRYPAIEAQIKSWSSPKTDGQNYRYPLDIKNYDDLVGKVGADFPLPRYLILVIVPANKDEYVAFSGDCIMFHRAAYWTSLMAETPATELTVTTTKTVSVPRSNLLTTCALTDLLGSFPGGEADGRPDHRY